MEKSFLEKLLVRKNKNQSDVGKIGLDPKVLATMNTYNSQKIQMAVDYCCEKGMNKKQAIETILKKW
jgi:hypothetical protein